MPTLECKFSIAQWVNIDGCKELRARIVGVRWYATTAPEYLVEWMNNGAMQTATIDEWRLTDAD